MDKPIKPHKPKRILNTGIQGIILNTSKRARSPVNTVLLANLVQINKTQ